MSYELVFKPAAVKDLRRLPKAIQKRMKLKLQFFLSHDDPLHFAIPLIGDGKAGQYRFRVGDYRILFDVEGIKMIILTIEHRREVYRKR